MTVLVPGYLKWNGVAYIIDTDLIGAQGPAGPTGSIGPAGPEGPEGPAGSSSDTIYYATTIPQDIETAGPPVLITSVLIDDNTMNSLTVNVIANGYNDKDGYNLESSMYVFDIVRYNGYMFNTNYPGLFPINTILGNDWNVTIQYSAIDYKVDLYAVSNIALSNINYAITYKLITGTALGSPPIAM